MILKPTPTIRHWHPRIRIISMCIRTLNITVFRRLGSHFLDQIYHF